MMVIGEFAERGGKLNDVYVFSVGGGAIEAGNCNA